MTKEEKEKILENIETISADIYDIDEMALALEQIGVASSNMIHELVETVEFYRKQVDKSVIEIQSLLSIIDKAIEYIRNNYNLNWYVESNYKNELLEILKGENNDYRRNR